MESKELRRNCQLSSQPLKVTLEALNMAAKLMAKMDLMEIRP